MHHIQFGRLERYVPTAWHELSRRQLEAVATALYECQGEALIRALLAALMSWPRWLAPAILTPAYCQQHAHLVQFLLDDVAIAEQLIPSVRPAWWRGRLFGPAAKLANVQFLEFVFADSLFMAAIRPKADGKVLDQFVATLYRPQRAGYNPTAPDYGGDRRQDFNRHLIEHHAAAVARLPLATKRAILLWYRGCRRLLEERYEDLFDKRGPTSNKPPALLWDQVRRNLAGSKFGDLAGTDRARLADVLAELNDLAVAAAKQPTS